MTAPRPNPPATPPATGRAARRALGTYVALMRAANAVTHRAHTHLRDHNLTLGQFGVLEALLHKGPMRAGEVAAKILVSDANMTTILDNLERRALVRRVRSDEDRRALAIHLTSEGERLIRRIFPAHAAGLAEALGALTAADQDALRALLRPLIDGADVDRTS